MIVPGSISATGKAGSSWQEAAAILPGDTPLPASAEHEPDLEETVRQVQDEARSMGFESLEYILVKRVGDNLHLKDQPLTHASTRWTRNYVESRQFEVDPRLQIVCRQETPLVWDLSLLHAAAGANPPDRRVADFLKAADAAGMRSGVMLGIAHSGGIDHAALGFCSGRESSAWITDCMVGQCYAAGLRLHAALNQAASPDDIELGAPVLALSDIQRDTLKLMIDGLSSREIGKALATSVQNVDYHIRELRRKFGARNRVQLAYAAGRLLIE